MLMGIHRAQVRIRRGTARRGRASRARRHRYSMRVAIGVPTSMVRPTVQSLSCDLRTTSGSTARASPPAAVSGNAIRNVTTISARRLPASSRTFSASTLTSKESGSARREVRMSTSMDVQPPIAASSSSVGVKSGPSPVPKKISRPRSPGQPVGQPRGEQHVTRIGAYGDRQVDGAEQGNLRCDRLPGPDELREVGEEEYRDLRVEQLDDQPAAVGSPEPAPGGAGTSLIPALGLLRVLAPGPDAKQDEVRRAAVTQHGQRD